MKQEFQRLCVLVHRKEWPEQRPALLLGLSTLLVLWASAVGVAFLAANTDAAHRVLAVWARYGYPLAVVFFLLPAHSLLASILAFRESPRTGSFEFLSALPVRAEETRFAKMLSAIGSAGVFLLLAWLLQAVLSLWISKETTGPALFQHGWRIQLLAVGVLVLAPIVAGMTAAALARRLPVELLLGAALTLALLAVPIFVCTRLARYGWWPLLVAPAVAGTLFIATGIGGHVWARRLAGSVPSGDGGLLGVCALAGALFLAVAIYLALGTSIRPQNAEFSIVSSSPGETSLAIRLYRAGTPIGPKHRTWRWDRPLDGPLYPLPFLAPHILGWGGQPGRLLVIGAGPLDTGSHLYASLPEGELRPLCFLDPPPLASHRTGLLPGVEGTDYFFTVPEGPEETSHQGILRDTSCRIVSRLEDPREFRGWWGRELLVELGAGTVLVTPETGSIRPSPIQGRILALKKGRFLAAVRTDGSLHLWDERTRTESRLSEASAGQVWSHHLDTLDFDDRGDLMAWHPEVGVRTLAEEVTPLALLKGGNKLLVSTSAGSGGLAILHAGTRSQVPVEGSDAFAVHPHGLEASEALSSPDGRWILAASRDEIRFVSSETGRSYPLDVDGTVSTNWVMLPPDPSQGTPEATPAVLVENAGRLIAVSPSGYRVPLDPHGRASSP